ncbi:MAG: hypothetical protein ABF489_06825 [Bifidobacterium sp.]|uniref:hypothetical protein n=1 Tax=Bifidobacterium sp. TaxID=41200 RepID=UPI0039E9810D
MKDIIRSVSARTKNIIFGVLYAILVLIAIFPPLYLAGSGQGALFLGAPLSIWYWLGDFIVLVAVMFGFYAVENIRGEVDPENNPQTLTEGE